MSNLYFLPETINVSKLLSVVEIISLVTIPIVAFTAGFIQGLLSAVTYNFIASRIDGIKIKFKETH
jgi:hypothetical protein